MLADSDSSVFVTTDILFIWRAALADKDSARTTMMFSSKDAKKFGADLTRVKAFIWNPFCGLIGGELWLIS